MNKILKFSLAALLILGTAVVGNAAPQIKFTQAAKNYTSAWFTFDLCGLTNPPPPDPSLLATIFEGNANGVLAKNFNEVLTILNNSTLSHFGQYKKILTCNTRYPNNPGTIGIDFYQATKKQITCTIDFSNPQDSRIINLPSGAYCKNT